MEHLSQEQLALVFTELSLYSGQRIVLLDVGGRRDIPLTEHNRNVYCVDGVGKVVWQINADEPTVERDSFVSLSLNEKGEICADRFFGNEFVLDPETGVANHIGWRK